MSISDPIADMLTKIRNASRAGNDTVTLRMSNITLEILKILKGEGYILNFKTIAENKYPDLCVYLKYDEQNQPVIRNIRRISKPGCRMYVGYRNMPKVLSGLGTLILSTAKGVITDKRALHEKVGGELICSIW